jgi:hypothetical protein
MVSYCVSINGEWYGDDMPADKWDEDAAVSRTVKRVLAGGTYEAWLVYAEFPDGTFINYEDES